MRHGAGAAVAPANERHRLVGLQQRRGRDATRLERLEVLPPDDAVAGGLREQPRRADEADVATLQRLTQPIV